MVYRDVLTMLVRDMHIDVLLMREVKLKCFAFGEISCLWWETYSYLFLYSFLLLFTQFYWWVTEMVYRNVLTVLVREM